jgi:hypothetical protein
VITIPVQIHSIHTFHNGYGTVLAQVPVKFDAKVKVTYRYQPLNKLINVASTILECTSCLRSWSPLQICVTLLLEQVTGKFIAELLR